MITTRKRYIFSTQRIIRPDYRQVTGDEATDFLRDHHYEFSYVDDTGLVHFRTRQSDRIERKYLYEVTDLQL